MLIHCKFKINKALMPEMLSDEKYFFLKELFINFTYSYLGIILI